MSYLSRSTQKMLYIFNSRKEKVEKKKNLYFSLAVSPPPHVFVHEIMARQGILCLSACVCCSSSQSPACYCLLDGSNNTPVCLSPTWTKVHSGIGNAEHYGGSSSTPAMCFENYRRGSKVPVSVWLNGGTGGLIWVARLRLH